MEGNVSNKDDECELSKKSVKCTLKRRKKGRILLLPMIYESVRVHVCMYLHVHMSVDEFLAFTSEERISV